jgi:hypothetical protein
MFRRFAGRWSPALYENIRRACPLSAASFRQTPASAQAGAAKNLKSVYKSIP